MDRALPEGIIRKRKIKYILISAGAVAAAAGLLGLFSFLLKPEIRSSRIIYAYAEFGEVESAITATGVVEPKYELALTSPVQTNIVSVYHKAGEKIKKGDRLLKLNKEFIQNDYDKLKDELDLKKNRKLQKQINLKNSLVERKTGFEIQEMNVKYNLSKLNREEKLFRIGGATEASLEGAKADYEKSVMEREKLKVQMDNQTQLQKAEIRELDLEIKMQENSLRQMARQIELAEMKAENDGIITWVNEKTGTSVGSGETVARISDLSDYNIQCQISDIHALKIAPGGRVKIRINEISMEGKISAVNPAVSNGTVPFTVAVGKENFTHLRPNQRVEVFVITSRARKVLRVKNGPFYSGFARQNVYVISGQKAVKKSVEFGEAGIDYVEIKKGLAEGDRVIVSDMKEYENYSELEIR